jgi:hypothetical protein
MAFWIDVYNPGAGPSTPGSRLGTGPITAALHWRSESKLDAAGQFTFEVPANAANVTLLQVRRVVWCWSPTASGLVFMGAGTIERIERRVGDPVTLRVSGPDLLAELAERTVGNLRVHERGWTLLNEGKGSVRDLSNVDEADLPQAYDGNFGTWTTPFWIRDDRFLYIGYDARFDIIRLTFQSPNIEDRSASLQYQYFTEEDGWTDIPGGVVDTTVVGDKPFKQNGTITFNRPADWARSTPTRASGSWFWVRIRRVPGSGNNFRIALTEAEVYADMPTHDGLAQVMAHAPTAWVSGVTFPATVSEKYLEFDGESVLQALVTLAEHGGQSGGQAIREHFRLGEGRELDWLGTTLEHSGVRASRVGDCLIRSLTVTEDTSEVVTRIYPRSADGITLALTERSAPAGFTLSKAGQYLQHNAGFSQLGLIEAQIRFNDVSMQQAESSLVHPTMAANALFDRAVEYLRTHGSINHFYRAEVLYQEGKIQPGKLVDVVWFDPEYALSIDQTLHVIGVVKEVNTQGLWTTRLEIATIDRSALTEASVLAGAVVDSRKPPPPGGTFMVGVIPVAQPIIDDRSRFVFETENLRIGGSLVMGTGGIMQAENYVGAVSGWIVRGDGSVEFSDGVFRGHVAADSGTIGGWEIHPTYLQSPGALVILESAGYAIFGDENEIVAIDGTHPTYRLWAGSLSAPEAAFSVTKGGLLFATGATIAGTITAEAGAIGGWTIHDNRLESTAGGSEAILSSAGFLRLGIGNNIIQLSAVDPAGNRIWAGHASPGDAPFRVKQDGSLEASKGVIAGWEIHDEWLIGIGATGSTYLYKNGSIALGGHAPGDLLYLSATDADYRIWAGHPNSFEAAFRVSKDGVLYATGATIEGDITADSGTIAGVLEMGVAGEVYSATAYRLDQDGLTLQAPTILGNTAFVQWMNSLTDPGAVITGGAYNWRIIATSQVWGEFMAKGTASETDAAVRLTAEGISGRPVWDFTLSSRDDQLVVRRNYANLLTLSGVGSLGIPGQVKIGQGVTIRTVGDGEIETILDRDNWRMRVHKTSGGWARNVMLVENTSGTSWMRIGAYGSGQTFSYMYMGQTWSDNSLRVYPDGHLRLYGARAYTDFRFLPGTGITHDQATIVGQPLLYDGTRFRPSLAGLYPLQVFARRASPWNTDYGAAGGEWLNMSEFTLDGTAQALPTDIEAIYAQIVFRAPASGRSVRMGPDETYDTALDVQSQVANVWTTGSGFVPVKDGRVRLTRNGAVDDVSVRIWGYYRAGSI